jgi:hypothetical protein
LLAKAFVPLALLFILSACGGATQGNHDSTRLLRGRGFSFSIPAGWHSSAAHGLVGARSGPAAVSVRTFALVKPYAPEKFRAVTLELDRDVAKLAAQAQQPLTVKETTEVAGEKIRAYRYGTIRIGFYFAGRREYQLLCRLGPGGADKDGACALLFASFSAA